jgi:NADPH:quinone reductase-like Zn-dependent oxidoreductase
MQTEAMVIREHGGPEVLRRESIELGELGPREVRVRVHAVALNHIDLWVRRGGPAFKLAFPHRLGADIAGEVEALGPGARGLSVGDRVIVHPARSCSLCAACKSGRDNLCRRYQILGENTQGGYARHIHAPDDALLPIGDALTFVEAAALPLTTLTAWQMVFDKGEVRPWHHVLVNSAGSGVSVMLVQMCKLVGARVIVSTTHADKAKGARALGADEVIVTSEADLTAETKRLTDRVGVDVAFDHVGGPTFEKTLAATRWGGRVVICGATSGFSPAIDLRSIFFKQIEIRGSTMGTRGHLGEALPLLLAGRLHQVVDRTLPLWDAAEAHRALESGALFGKLVLTVQ